MNWKIVLTLANGMTEDLYCVTRQECRNLARFYRTMTDHNSDRAVVSTRIVRL